MPQIHIMHASGKFDADDTLARKGLRRMYRRGADVITHTEYGRPHWIKMVEKEAEAAGYGNVIEFGTGSVILLSHEFTKVSAARHKVVPPLRLRADQGGHGPRDVIVAEGLFRGNRISMSTFHGLAGSNDTPQRMDKTLEMVDELGDVVAANARGRDIAFWSADTNVDPDDKLAAAYNKLLRKHGLISCFEELGREIPTAHRRTIDVVGSAKRDGRVDLLDVKVWPKVPSFDHKQTSAWYRIKK